MQLQYYCGKTMVTMLTISKKRMLNWKVPIQNAFANIAQNIPKSEADSIEFPVGFDKTLQITIKNSSITQGRKNFHQISFWGKIQRVKPGILTKTTRFP